MDIEIFEDEKVTCPICGKVGSVHEHGAIEVHTAVNSPHDLQVITACVCGRCADGMFEAIKNNIPADCYYLHY